MNVVSSRLLHKIISRTAACVIFLLAFSLPSSRAGDLEAEMFAKGYEYILSLDPDNAAKTFRTFLQQFPQSSARDAAMFWLGRALISQKSYAEAEQLFFAIRQEFPESPYIRFIDTPLEEIAILRMSPSAPSSGDLPPPVDGVPLKQDNATHVHDKEMAQVLEDRNRIRALLEQEKGVRGDLQLRVSELEEKERLLSRRVAEAESSLQKLSASEIALKTSKHEKDRLTSETEILQAENTVLEARAQDAEKRVEQGITGMNLLNSYLAQCMAQTDGTATDFAAVPSPELEKLWSELTTESEASPKEKVETEVSEPITREPAAEQPAVMEARQAPQETEFKPARKEASAPGPLVIRGKTYSRAEVDRVMAVSARVLAKLGLKEPAWRRGDPLEDFIDERLLAAAAESSGVGVDEKAYRDTADRLQLSQEEAEYLRTFMMIGSFIGRNHMNSAPDLFVETLTAHYTDRDSAAYADIAADILNASRSGKSFEEIGQQYRNFVKLSRLRIDEFASLYRSKSHIIDKLNFQSGETVVVWSEEGFVIIMPVAAYKLFDPFADSDAEEREHIRTLLSGYIADLKKNWQLQ